MRFRVERFPRGSRTEKLHLIHPQEGSIGSLQYVRHPDHLQIEMMRVKREHRGNGYAGQLMDELQRRNPATPIDHGERTDDGNDWWDAYSSGKDVQNGRTMASLYVAEKHPTRDSVPRITHEYSFADGDSWPEVRDNFVMDHPSMRRMRDDIRQNGIQKPIAIDYEQTPPRVLDGHTRLAHAEALGMSHVPVRHVTQFEHALENADPEDSHYEPPRERFQPPHESMVRNGATELGHDLGDFHPHPKSDRMRVAQCKNCGAEGIYSETGQMGGRAIQEPCAIHHTAAIRMVSPEEYRTFRYPDYPKAKTPDALVRHFKKTSPDYYNKIREDVQQNGFTTQWPQSATHEELKSLIPGFDQDLHVGHEHEVYDYHPAYPLKEGTGLRKGKSPWGFYTEDSRARDEDLDRWSDLQDRIKKAPTEVHPIVVSGGRLLDGFHRASLALNARKKTFHAYVARDEDSPRTAAAILPHKRLFGPTFGLDHRLFDRDTLKPEIRRAIITKWSSFCERHNYGDWTNWAKIVFFGSEASTWTSPTLEGNNDFDLSIGVEYERFREVAPVARGMSDELIASALTQEMHAELNDPDTYYDLADGSRIGPFDQTWFQNELGWDIRQIRPYAAYDVVRAQWIVQPPDLPRWDITQFPEGHGLTREILGIIEMARGVLAMPEPYRTQNGDALWHFVHDNRSDAFGPQGEGWWDVRNVVEKALDQKGLMQELYACHDRADHTPGSLDAPAGWSNDPGAVG